MKKILMTRLSVCSLGVSCNEMIDTPMLLVVPYSLSQPGETVTNTIFTNKQYYQ